MKKKATKKPKASLKQIVSARDELEDIKKKKAQLEAREKELRHKIADVFHDGEHGTKTTKLHGFAVKVNRKQNITAKKDDLEALEEANQDLYDEVVVVEAKLHETSARQQLEKLGDFVTVKQGLPTITITELEE